MAQRVREQQQRNREQAQAGRSGGQWDGNRSGERDRGQWDGNRSGDRRQGDGGRRQADANGWNRDGGRGGWDRDHRGPQQRPSWARPDGRYDRDHNRPRYDQRRYPHYFQAPHRYRTTTYIVPYGFYDYSWSFGDYLPWGWYGPSYWIGDWFAYGLPPPPIGCEWVRVGRDALLIDTFDGRVLSVARLLFW
jgi:Ni/Co efflux regulator RcnB